MKGKKRPWNREECRSFLEFAEIRMQRARERKKEKREKDNGGRKKESLSLSVPKSEAMPVF